MSGQTESRQPRPHEYIHFHLCPADDTGIRVGTGICRCDELAYDGSNAPPARPLTARERDIIGRICGQLVRSEPGQIMDVYRTEMPILRDIMLAIDPRNEDRDPDTPLEPPCDDCGLTAGRHDPDHACSQP